MPTSDDVAFAGIASREGLLSQEELERSLELQEALRQIGARACLHGILVAEKVIDIGQVNRILAHQKKVDLLCPSCESTQSVLAFSLKPVFRCRSCSTELPLPVGILPSEVETIRGKIREVLLWYEAESLAGRTLGGVQILRKVGQGRMGVVYEGLLLQSDQPVAIRVFPKTLGKSKPYVDCFRFEAEVMTRVNHPNVAKVFRTGEARDRQYMVMERLEGKTLQEILVERGPLPIKEAIATITQAAQGLRAAHERGLVHRDIKPANIVLTEGGTVKVADFGIAKNREEVAQAIGARPVLGTPAYLSPEQAAGRPADARSDIYSLGATFYQALLGQPPFVGEDVVSALNSHIHENPTPPHVVREDVPRDVSLVVTRMLAKRPEDRYAGAPALIAALRRLGAEPEGVPRVPSSVSAPRYLTSSLHLMILVALGTGALAMAIWLVYRLSDQIRDQTFGTTIPGLDPVGDEDPPREYRSKADGAVMVLIPEGDSVLGSSGSWAGPHEGPAHTVRLDSYLMDKHEVSNSRYARFLEYLERTGDHSRCFPGEPPGKSHRPASGGTWAEGDRPVVGIDWYDAYAFAAWAHKRLPTEAEWERAARPDGRIYPWGNEWESSRAVSAESWAGKRNGTDPEVIYHELKPWESAKTTSVEDHAEGASPFGVHHLAGNVSEWVQDRYRPDAHGSSSGRNPQGPVSGYERTIRGGSWRDLPPRLRSTGRWPLAPGSRNLQVGFRCARDPGPPP